MVRWQHICGSVLVLIGSVTAVHTLTQIITYAIGDLDKGWPAYVWGFISAILFLVGFFLIRIEDGKSDQKH